MRVRPPADGVEARATCNGPGHDSWESFGTLDGRIATFSVSQATTSIIITRSVVPLDIRRSRRRLHLAAGVER
jgi:hypothetical protein